MTKDATSRRRRALKEVPPGTMEGRMGTNVCHPRGGIIRGRSSRINRFHSKKERAVQAETGGQRVGGSVWEVTNLVWRVREMARAGRQLGSDWKA